MAVFEEYWASLPWFLFSFSFLCLCLRLCLSLTRDNGDTRVSVPDIELPHEIAVSADCRYEFLHGPEVVEFGGVQDHDVELDIGLVEGSFQNLPAFLVGSDFVIRVGGGGGN